MLIWNTKRNLSQNSLLVSSADSLGNNSYALEESSQLLVSVLIQGKVSKSYLYCEKHPLNSSSLSTIFTIRPLWHFTLDWNLSLFHFHPFSSKYLTISLFLSLGHNIFLLLLISASLISCTDIASSRSPSQLAFGQGVRHGWLGGRRQWSIMFKNGLVCEDGRW